MNTVRDRETNTIFDDFTDQPNDANYDTDTWTQVCDSCARKYHLLDSYLAIGDGSGICGVEGCQNEADHYYDFNRA